MGAIEPDQHADKVAAQPKDVSVQGSDRHLHMVFAQMADNPIILRYLPRRHESDAVATAKCDLELDGLLMYRYIRNNCPALKTQLP